MLAQVLLPGYLVTRTDETEVTYYGKSPFINDSHAEKVRITKPASAPKPMPQSEGYRGGRR
jgi:small subunit ribosomal protein S4